MFILGFVTYHIIAETIKFLLTANWSNFKQFLIEKRVAIIIGLMPIFACMTLFTMLVSGIIGPPIRYLESFVGTPFPEEATHTKGSWGIIIGTDEWHFIRFKLPPDRLAEYLDGLCFEKGLSRDYPPGYRIPHLPWWKPHKAAIYEGAECINKNNGTFLEIWVDESDPDLYIIYVHAYTM